MNPKVKEFDIQHLVEDLKPAKAAMGTLQFCFKLSIFVVVLYIIGLWMLPTRDSIAQQTTQFFYHVENALWLFVAYLSAYSAYLMSLPSVSSLATKISATICLVLLSASIFYRMPDINLASSFMFEMQLWRGWCGGIIIFFGLILSYPLFKWMRQGLISKPWQASTMLALGVGSAASFLIQVVCDHGASIHIFIWHYAPIVVLNVIFIAVLSRKPS